MYIAVFFMKSKLISKNEKLNSCACSRQYIPATIKAVLWIEAG